MVNHGDLHLDCQDVTLKGKGRFLEYTSVRLLERTGSRLPSRLVRALIAQIDSLIVTRL